jgi:replicative DNA helicase
MTALANHDLEREAIGIMLSDDAGQCAVLSLARDEDFTHTGYLAVFATVRRLAKASSPVDFVTVVEDLKETGELETIGGPSFIGSTFEIHGMASHAGYYVGLLRKLAAKRSLVAAASSIIADAQSEESDIEGATDRAAAAIRATLSPSLDADAYTMRDALSAGVDRVNGTTPPERVRSTGFVGLDKVLGGGMVDRLYAVMGRPGHGKTAIMLRIATHVARAGGKVSEHHLELDEQEVFRRRMSEGSDVYEHKIRVPSLLDHEWDMPRIMDHAEAISGYGERIRLHCTVGVTADRIAAIAHSDSAQMDGLDLVLVDHLHIMQHPGQKGDRLDTRMGYSSGVFRDLARQLCCPVLVGCQLSRSADGRGGWQSRPSMSDIREVGALEQDAYAALGCFMPWKYDLVWTKDHGAAREGVKCSKTYAEINVPKNRGGECGWVPMRFDGPTMRWSDDRGEDERQDVPTRKWG